VDKKTRPTGFGIPDVFHDQHERIDRPVGNPHGADQPRIKSRLERQRFPCGKKQCFDSRIPAGPDEIRPVFRTILGKRDKQSIRRFDTVGGDLPEDPVFSDAFRCRVRIVHGITRPAVEKPLVAAGGAGGEIPLLDQQRGDAPEREVARDAGPRGAAADDQHFRSQVHGFPYGSPTVKKL